ncbi:MAG: hypothetical protein ABIR18_13185 [Chitinophagaceae bacterium]
MSQKKNNVSKKIQSIRITVRKSLDKYADKILFPEKLAKANKLLKGIKLP